MKLGRPTKEESEKRRQLKEAMTPAEPKERPEIIRDHEPDYSLPGDKTNTTILVDQFRHVMEQPMVQEGDLTGAVRLMNEDKIERETGLPSIDLRTRLTDFEVSNILVHDAVIALGCLPKECLVTTRTKKRLAVSLGGKGRSEIVEIVRGEREQKSGTGFMDKMKGMFSPAKPNP